MQETIQALKEEIKTLKKNAIRSQYLLDEGIEIMTGVHERIVTLMSAIKEHRFRTEDAKLTISDYDEKLWEVLEEMEKLEEQ